MRCDLRKSNSQIDTCSYEEDRCNLLTLRPLKPTIHNEMITYDVIPQPCQMSVMDHASNLCIA